MANEMDELIWRVLDGKASPGEVRRVAEWVREPGNRKYFRQLRKVWNLVNGPRVTPERKRVELERFRNFMRQQPGGKERRFARRMGWYKYAAVVFIPVLIAVYLSWHEFAREDTRVLLSEEPVYPGTRQVILTIADGDTIALPPNRDVDIQLAGQLRVVSSGEGITYELGEGENEGEERYNTLATPVGGEYQVVLSDGSRVWLNALTELRYPEIFKEDCREVYLSGEAYFEVEHDPERPFVVVANGVEVTVYGTRFNVNNYGTDVVRTVLVDGKVGIRVAGSGKEVVLSPSDMAECFEGTREVKVRKVDPYVYTAWKEGKFVFEDEPVEEIMARLSNWYGIKVFYTDERVKKQTFTGVITRYTEVGNVLHLIGETAVVRFQLNGNVVTVGT